LAALVILALTAGTAGAQSESALLRVREGGAALVRGNIDQAITIYTEAPMIRPSPMIAGRRFSTIAG
jgi:hypothetical protein